MPERLRLYYEKRHLINTGDAIQWCSDSIIGRLIRLFSKASSNHTSIGLRLAEFATLIDHRWVVEALAYGVDINRLSRRLERHRGQAWLLPLKAEYDEYRPAIAAWAIEKDGIPYDFESLLKNAIAKVLPEMRRFFCSELYFCCLRDCIPELGEKWKDMKAPRPGDIPNLGVHDNPILIYDYP